MLWKFPDFNFFAVVSNSYTSSLLIQSWWNHQLWLPAQRLSPVFTNDWVFCLFKVKNRRSRPPKFLANWTSLACLSKWDRLNEVWRKHSLWSIQNKRVQIGPQGNYNFWYLNQFFELQEEKNTLKDKGDHSCTVKTNSSLAWNLYTALMKLKAPYFT